MPGKLMTQLMADSASGFFGKIPSRGDFVSRRIEPAFLTVFDEWLQAGILKSREAFGDEWLKIYLSSPIWRFVIGSPFSGIQSYVGVMLPSVDRAGRYFPFAIVSQPLTQRHISFFSEPMSRWYSEVEQLAVSVLDENFELETFDHAVASIKMPYLEDLAYAFMGRSAAIAQSAVCYTSTSIDSLVKIGGSTTCSFADDALEGLSVWWTAGSGLVQPSLLVHSGLPSPDVFTAMLDGGWSVREIAVQSMPIGRNCMAEEPGMREK